MRRLCFGLLGLPPEEGREKTEPKQRSRKGPDGRQQHFGGLGESQSSCVRGRLPAAGLEWGFSMQQRIPPARLVSGAIDLPGDKSISHRYAMIASIASLA